MKKTLTMLVLALTLCLGLAIAVNAADIVDGGYCGGEGDGTNLSWTLDSDGVLTISGTGKMKDYLEDGYLLPVPFPLYFNTVYISDGVTSVGDYAFSYYESLKNVIISDSVNDIGEGAFGACTNLTSVIIPDSVTTVGNHAFTNCGLTSVTIGNSVVSIGIGAFSYCKDLPGIVIPDSVTTIGSSAFSECYNLENVVIPNSVVSIGDSAFSGSGIINVTIPSNITSIGNQTFFQCKNLISVIIPAGITTIGDVAFYECQNLTDVYYGGNEAQWSGISIGLGNNSLLNATIHYNDSSGGETSTTTPVAGFTDVSPSDYYANAVEWAYMNSVITGTTETTFSPLDTATRAQVVTFLWRAVGQPEPQAADGVPFNDIDQNEYYYKAILWAVQNGITNGTGDGAFSPHQTCSRAHIVTFLYRAMGWENWTGQGNWYDDAVRWANGDDLLSGTALAFEPEADCPRADVVYYLWKELA